MVLCLEDHKEFSFTNIQDKHISFTLHKHFFFNTTFSCTGPLKDKIRWEFSNFIIVILCYINYSLSLTFISKVKTILIKIPKLHTKNSNPLQEPENCVENIWLRKNKLKVSMTQSYFLLRMIVPALIILGLL
jgi:hypothetical protein